jgi:hypothetical protein
MIASVDTSAIVCIHSVSQLAVGWRLNDGCCTTAADIDDPGWAFSATGKEAANESDPTASNE